MSVHNKRNTPVNIEVFNIKGQKIDDFVILPHEVKPIKYTENTVCLTCNEHKTTIAVGTDIIIDDNFLDITGGMLPQVCLNISENQCCVPYAIILPLLIFLLIIFIIFYFRKKIF
jgi:nitrate reductase cytochrome c-type subunit